MYSNYYNQLNDKQKAVVDNIKEHVVVLAGPGTGKTQVLSVRTANILKRNNASPSNILILSFTNAASGTIRERIVEIIGADGYFVEVETYHSLANSIITESEEVSEAFGEKIELHDTERIKLIRYILDNLDNISQIRPFRAPYHYEKEIIRNINILKREGITPDDFSQCLSNIFTDGEIIQEKHIPKLNQFEKVYRMYEELKDSGEKHVLDERGRYDFDDMIIMATHILNHDKNLGKKYRGKFSYIMVDEFQDTNKAQLKLLLSLINPKKTNLCVVGDDDQSIYRFQGASIANFRTIKDRFKNLTQMTLTENYRSTPEILNISRKLIEEIPSHKRISQKSLVPHHRLKSVVFSNGVKSLKFGSLREEVSFIVEEIKRLVREKIIPGDDPYSDIAILLRTRKDILPIIDAFLQTGIPYVTDGKEDISSHLRVRQLFSALNLAVNSHNPEHADRYIFELLASDYFEIDVSDMTALLSYVSLKKRKNINGNKSITFLEEITSGFPGNTSPTEQESNQLKITKHINLKKPLKLHKFSWAIQRLIKDSGTRSVHQLILQYIKDSGMLEFILAQYETDQILKVRDLRAISSFIECVKEQVTTNPIMTITDFVGNINLQQSYGIGIQGILASSHQKGVRVLTAHSGKGTEFHTVFIPFCIHDKKWPKKLITDLIPIPQTILQIPESVCSLEAMKKLHIYDEIRLFYVACTRAKANLFFTAAPLEKDITSMFLKNMDIEPQPCLIPEEHVLRFSIDTVKERPPFLQTDEILKDYVKFITLNPTNVNDYVKCKRSFLYNNLLMIPSELTESLLFGTCVHKALSKTYEIYKKRQSLSRRSLPGFSFFENVFKTCLENMSPGQRIEQGCLGKVEELRNWYQKKAESPACVLFIEKSLGIFINENIPFSGRFDRIDTVGNNRNVCVIDYKTGDAYRHIKSITDNNDPLNKDCDPYLHQLIAYKLILENQPEPYKVASCKLEFLEPAKRTVKKYDIEEGEYKTLELTITDKMAEDMKKLIIDVWKRIHNLEFEKLSEYDKTKCDNCNFRCVCWEV
ncbi:MAG: ATP-dependent DNA helicase [bacterium]|nr:ATP-dependent DNA helicase [bacterium]